MRINSVVAFYPYCKGALSWKQPTPVLTLVGLADNIAPFALCKGLVKEALDNKSMRVVEEYPVPFVAPASTFPPVTAPPSARVAGTEKAGAQSWSELEAFLKSYDRCSRRGRLPKGQAERHAPELPGVAEVSFLNPCPAASN